MAARCTSASKFALRGIVVQLAHELAPDVRVNGSRPAGRLPPTCAAHAASVSTANGSTTDRAASSSSRRARRCGVALTGADHAGAYVFLASDAARGMTGEIVRSDGGLGVR